MSKVRITGASRDSVAQALWEAGEEDIMIDSIHGHCCEKVFWPSVEQINKRKVVMKYDCSRPGWGRSCRDTMKIMEEKPEAVVVSLRCKQTGFFAWGMHRNTRKERELLLRATKKLQGRETTHIEWIGDWRPAN